MRCCLISDVTYPCVVESIPRASHTALAIAYSPQSFGLGCQETSVNKTFMTSDRFGGVPLRIILQILCCTGNETEVKELSWTLTSLPLRLHFTVESVSQWLPPASGFLLTTCIKLPFTGRNVSYLRMPTNY